MQYSANAPGPTRKPQGVAVTFRRMKFPFENAGFARYWHGGSAFKSLFWAQLSTSFSPGETFFIDSARALKHHLVDAPELLEEIAEFCRQEGHHTAQHLKFDRQNQALGVDVESCRARFAAVLAKARAELDAMEMLAATCALEHFTAALAERFLAHPAMSEGADPNVVALWRWHAAEECEHKATCYDLYQRLGGGYGRRVSALHGTWGLLMWVSLVNTFSLLAKDGRLWTRDTLSGLYYLFGPRGVFSGQLPAFVRYLMPRFHPWTKDSSALIRRALDEGAPYVVHSVR